MKKRKLFQANADENTEHAYHSPLEHKVKKILTPFEEYINSQVTASIFLIGCTLIALAWASISSISNWYMSFVTIPVGFHISSFVVNKSLQFWVNDVLLTLFFFFVGLEIKREFLVGELTNHKRAIFIIFAAIGGMVFPAVIYFLFNVGTPDQLGWGIPMATDTAFALGILSCFRNKVPKGVFTFLAALAIIDDIGAIIVIAIFYTSHINVWMLFITFLLVAFLILLNYSGFRRPLPYIIVGLLVWLSIEKSGIHGTVAGILIAFIIPARPTTGPKQFIHHAKGLLKHFEKRKDETALILEDEKQHAVLEEVRDVALKATTPLQQWESRLELPIALFILPLFAFVNAGIPINLALVDNVFTHAVSLGIIFGLVIGKPLGIIFFSKISLWCKIGIMPEETNFKQLISASILTGIGFTMSLFVANLSFINENTLVVAKGAILISSAIAALAGMFFIYLINRS